MKKDDDITRRDGMLNEFKQWLEKSSCRFSNRPILFHEGKECLDFRSDRVTSELSFTICEIGTAEIRVIYQDEWWDIIAEFDVWEQDAPSGQYYCEGCKEKKLFSSRRALWEEHIFEPFLDWANKNFITSNWLCIFEIGGARWASIAAEESVESAYAQKGFLMALPVVENFPQQNQ